MVLTKLKATAETYLGHPIKSAVIAVPAYFNDAQRSATKDAGTIAGLNVLRIINEPTAAAIAYGLDKCQGSEKTILVYDLGGGIFDVSLLSVKDDVLEVLATAGDAQLGGEDFDRRVITYLVQTYKSRTGRDVSSNEKALCKLKLEAERAKWTLSSQMSAKIDIEGFDDGHDFSETLTRAKFEELNMDLFLRTIRPVKRVLRGAKIKKEDVNDVCALPSLPVFSLTELQIILIGGSTHIPKIQELVRDYFGKEPQQGINPDEAVAYGAAIQGRTLSTSRTTKTKRI